MKNEYCRICIHAGYEYKEGKTYLACHFGSLRPRVMIGWNGDCNQFQTNKTPIELAAFRYKTNEE